MAPHALTDYHDTSGYSPATVHFDSLLLDSKSHARVEIITPETEATILNSASNSSKTGNLQSPYFWHLSSNEIREIESSVEYFQCTLLVPLKLPSI